MLEPGRVAIFGSYAPSLINFRGPLIAAMTARGHEVHALAPAMDAGTEASLNAIGATPVSLGLSNPSLNPFAAFASIRRIRGALRRIRPDIVIAYTIKPVVLGAIAARAERIPCFVPLITGLGYAFNPGGGLRRRIGRLFATLLYRRAFAGAALAIFQNGDDRADFRALGLLPERLPTLVVNGSGVDLDHFQPEPLPPEPAFLMIARLLGDKGIREFAAAAARLKQARPDVRITLVGYPDESPDSLSRTELDALVAGGIDYAGRLEDVRPAIARASIYVLPSYREGMPRSVLEAMAMGRAIITTDVPGCRDTVVDGENGVLVPPRDADALFEAMDRLAGQPALVELMGAASLRLAREKFDVNKVNAAILDALAAAAGEREPIAGI